MTKVDSVKELDNPSFIKPVRINYTQDNISKTWEAVISHDSVSVLLWHEEKESFIVVKQLRPTILNRNKDDGHTYELCAGIIDKELSNIEIAQEEILEECGYDIPTSNIKKITSFYTSVGISGSHQTLYYATCDESMKRNDGGGIDEEDIEVIYIRLKDAKEFIFDEKYKKTPGMIMAFLWFFENIKSA